MPEQGQVSQSKNKGLPTDPHRRVLREVKKHLVQLIFATLALMVLGSYVRITESGLACPDWPLCFDRVVPPFDYQIFLEWIHRVYAACVGVYFGYVAFRILKVPSLRKALSTYLLIALGLFVWQVILGGLTVLKLLNPTIVSWHLVNATIFVALLIFIDAKLEFLTENNGNSARAHPVVYKLVLLSFVFIFFQIMVGGIVSSNYAGPVCADLPKCGGQWWPTQNPQGLIHMAHRFLGIFVLLAFSAMAIVTKLLNPHHNRVKLIYLSAALVYIQVAFGIALVFYEMPTWLRVIHLANALLCFALSTYLSSRFLLMENLNKREQRLTGSNRHPRVYSGAKI